MFDHQYCRLNMMVDTAVICNFTVYVWSYLCPPYYILCLNITKRLDGWKAIRIIPVGMWGLSMVGSGLAFRRWTWTLRPLRTQQFGLLRRFLRTNKIPEELRQRVTRFLHHAYLQRLGTKGVFQRFAKIKKYTHSGNWNFQGFPNIKKDAHSGTWTVCHWK